MIEDDVIQIQSRSMSDPALSDIDFKNKMALVWTTLKKNRFRLKFTMDRKKWMAQVHDELNTDNKMQAKYSGPRV